MLAALLLTGGYSWRQFHGVPTEFVMQQAVMQQAVLKRGWWLLAALPLLIHACLLYRYAVNAPRLDDFTEILTFLPDWHAASMAVKNRIVVPLLPTKSSASDRGTLPPQPLT